MVLPSAEDPEVAYKRNVVLASTILVFIASTGSYILRIWARIKQNQDFQWDDYLMGLALPFSYVPAVCLLYGLTVGLGEHQVNVSPVDLRKFQISLFILQRGNPPCLLCVKSSILLLYVRLFGTPKFKRSALVVWIFTVCWAISAFLSNLFQCTPVSYFWDKTQPGHCIPNALITIGLTNGVLSFVGDLIILSLPIPMLWKLQIDKRRKIALIGMFLLGGFVCVTSVLRFTALIEINIKDLTFTQVNPGVWTYIELGTGITSGNLPLLRPIFGKFFNATKIFGTRTHRTYDSHSHSQAIGGGPQLSRGDGFQRMGTADSDKKDIESIHESVSDIEMGKVPIDDDNSGIVVHTHVDQRIEMIREGIEAEVRRLASKESLGMVTSISRVDGSRSGSF